MKARFVESKILKLSMKYHHILSLILYSTLFQALSSLKIKLNICWHKPTGNLTTEHFTQKYLKKLVHQIWFLNLEIGFHLTKHPDLWLLIETMWKSMTPQAWWRLWHYQLLNCALWCVLVTFIPKKVLWKYKTLQLS